MMIMMIKLVFHLCTCRTTSDSIPRCTRHI